MKNILIYGCGEQGKKILHPLQVNYEYEVTGYIDRNIYKSQFSGIPVKSPEQIAEYDFDLIFVAIENYREAHSIKLHLIEQGVEEEKIRLACYSPDYIELFSDQRSEFIKDMARWIQENHIEGNVAECGVYRGDSAKFINRYFVDRKFYLFDTFEGFDHTDLSFEIDHISEGFNSSFFDENLFKNTSLDIIKEKMTKIENIIVKKGYFPETTHGVEDKFCFVNLDMDLYTPMLGGLRFFWDKWKREGAFYYMIIFMKGYRA